MSKHNHQSRAERIFNRAHGAQPFNYEKMPYQASEPMKSEFVQEKPAVDDSSIQYMAYQIYREKGGPALDNWLEAERILKNNEPTAAGFVTEGDSDAKQ